eukprot:gnl/TRDRNA2_/TRDRNA2_166378_c0_seq1.p1 gnl/TRDRNA2_/TRDRNA2_166378_c0~~gnl/TRDRNA2_/TRDRNA2_166378_c0_seq1.p1  ORF type:complete len:351 (+),score=51.50 gnl/TRDRNA2_/TRDRNA2_166378_c0_seq1:48-1055(+)
MSVAAYRRHFALEAAQASRADARAMREVPVALPEQKEAPVVLELKVPLGPTSALSEDCCVCYLGTCTRTVCDHPVCTACLALLREPLCCPLCRRALCAPGPVNSKSTIPGMRSGRPPPSEELDLPQLLQRTAAATSVTALASTLLAPSAARCRSTADGLYALRQAATERCAALVEPLSLRGLSRHVEALCHLQAAGLLVSAPDVEAGEALAQEESGHCPGGINTALENVLCRAIEDRGAPSLQALRPIAAVFARLREAGLLSPHGRSATALVTLSLIAGRRDLALAGSAKRAALVIATELVAALSGSMPSGENIDDAAAALEALEALLKKLVPGT